MNGTQAAIASLQMRARVVRLALWFFIGIAACSLLGTLVILARQLQLADPQLLAFTIVRGFNMALWLALLLGVIPVILWVHRAHANLHEGGVSGLGYTAGWAAGSYFVPFVNCLVPFRAMTELYNRSQGEPADFAQSSAGPVTSWWACHIPAVFMSMALIVIVLMPLVSNVWVTAPPAATTGMDVFTQILWLGSAWFLLQTVNAITAAQAHGVATANVFD